MRELILSSEFKRFQKRQLKMMANHIWGKMKTGHYEEAKAAKELSFKILQDPYSILKDEQGERLKKEVIQEFGAEFIKIGL